jgi:hypothetical protein
MSEPATPPARRGRAVWILAAFVGAVGLVLLVAVGGLLEQRFREGGGHRSGNEATTIGCLRTLTTAQAIFRERSGPSPRYAGSLAALQGARYIDAILGSGTRQGYTFAVLQADALTWSAVASPIRSGRTGDRWFFVDQTGVIRFSTTGAASSLSTPIGG